MELGGIAFINPGVGVSVLIHCRHLQNMEQSSLEACLANNMGSPDVGAIADVNNSHVRVPRLTDGMDSPVFLLP